MKSPRSTFPFLMWLLCAALGLMATPGLRAQTVTVVTDARAMQPGELVVFTITAPADAETVAVDVFGRSVTAWRRDGPAQASSSTWLALVGIDLSVRPGAVAASVSARGPTGTVSTEQTIAVHRKAFPTRRLKVNPALVEPPASAVERITREVARVNDIYASSSPSALWNGPFIRPVDDPANSRFGSRSVFNGRPGSPHAGADFLSATGTPIKAPNGGRIRLAEDQYFSGNTIILDHGLGLFSVFAHLSAFKVQEGDVVNAGDVLGLVGATGRVTGPHLHWGVRVTGARVDPLSLLALLGTREPSARP